MTQSQFDYPPAPPGDVVDDFHGTPVADPYRWLEDPDDPRTLAWDDAQVRLTQDYLSEIPAREVIRRRLTELWNYPRWNVPLRKGKLLFYQKNDGLQNQSILYAQEPGGEPFVVLDPNTLRADGTAYLSSSKPDDAGKLLAYGVSFSGSDWQELRVREVDTGRDYDDVLRWCKFTAIAWAPDGSGFFYNRFPEPGSRPGTELGAYYSQVHFHKVGTPQAADILVYERPDFKELNFMPQLTDDGRYIVLGVWHGSINRHRIFYRLREGDGDFVRLIDEGDAEYLLVSSDGDTLYLQTNLNAPRGRIVAIDLDQPARERWRTLIPEGEDAILQTKMAGDHFIVRYMHHGHHKLRVYGLDGAFLREIPLPEVGTVESMESRRKDNDLYFSFQSYLTPQTVFHCDVASGDLTVWQQPETHFTDAADYQTTQVFFESKDGTRVPMFVTYRRGLKLDGTAPALLYGYGGFSASYTPVYHPWIIQWLEMGGVFAVAGLRGGSEYGEEWHKAGMLENKQNVFDDFIAASEYLQAEGYTSAKRLAIMGRSNGGLLVAACALQRPELFGAVLCIVPVTDMLRYHRFTVGRYWIPEYGDADNNPDHFAFLYAYSPLHTVKPGVAYPPMLITSADHDDRVVPLHARKFTAAMQAADAGNNPILLRLDRRSGHGLGKPTAKWIEEWTDLYGFLVRTLEIDGAG